MKKNIKFYTILVVLICIFLVSCDKEEKKPFGAENIEYDKVEGINKDGPQIDLSRPENVPPMADKVVIVENGPEHIDYPDVKIEPTADMSPEPDFGGIPVVPKR